MFEFSDSMILAIMQGIYDGEITEYDLPENLYLAIAKVLKNGLYLGAKGSLKDFELGTPDYELIAEMRENIYMFSAAKTYQEVRDISDMLLDVDGKINSFENFKLAADAIFEQYNVNWLKSEFDTAVGQAEMGMQWNKIIAQKEILPLLKYSANSDELVCDICAPLDGVVAKVDDPLWDEFYPENHFRCRCTVEQLEADEATPMSQDDLDKITGPVKDEMAPEFLMNAGKERVIFSDDHPYFQNVPKEFAIENFGLPIPDEDE